MRKCISEVVRKIGAYLQEDDTPSDEEIQKRDYTIDNPVISAKIGPKAKLPVEGQGTSEGTEGSTDKPKPDISDKTRISKRPHIKPPRREESFKTKWKGEGKREVRNEYQKEYRTEHGNT
jgi:hypothetical protein